MTFYKKFVPSNYYKSIKDINYEDLKTQGIKTLFFDLDNTIISYDETKVSSEMCKFLNNLKQDFKLIVISNSRKKRVQNALINCDLLFINYALKPLKRGFKKALKLIDSKPYEVVVIGDQLMTDVFGANRLNMKALLIGSVKRSSDRFITKINRALEKCVIKIIKKRALNIYEERLSVYEKDHL